MADSQPPGATPIDPDEAASLIPDHVPTRGELDELEEMNIQDGLAWSHRSLRKTLSEDFLFELHRRMFDAVWEWGGQQLTTTSDLRSRYIGALRAADAGDIHPLLEFARS